MKVADAIGAHLADLESKPQQPPSELFHRSLTLCIELAGETEVEEVFWGRRVYGQSGDAAVFLTTESLVEVSEAGFTTHTLRDFERIEVTPGNRNESAKITVNAHKAGGHAPMFGWTDPKGHHHGNEALNRLSKALIAAMER